ncbi:SIMPL domain-containing protein [Streptomyces sp. RPA4-5]|uniref:SIMPL domain-containing protein n=1 Tax=Streptomyces TaxID=1883 RepID=UPI00143E787D|nr:MULTISPECIES: SIMPL domain-containing protein [Streptomyces]MCX4633760.1 SIMPL domain-containing protein [Streptomyces platensis]QIY54983.1 SIMPL domain-containing protein [Streptomyces sp. RPA4-5]WJY37664.1 SIMPL domain-containing protein [Streptomyces sp. P9-2B-2]
MTDADDTPTVPTTGTTPGALPYGTPDTPRLAVRGEARLEVDPEIARLAVTVSARGTDRSTALADLTRRNEAALTLIKSYGDAIEKLETGTFSLTPQLTEKGRHERIRAYHGRVTHTATLNDFTLLGELTTRLADLDLTRVDGPWWALRPDSPAHRTARTQAVHEAVQRAREYAEALGARLDALLEIADLGAENSAPTAAPAMRSFAGYGGATQESAPALDLEPQRQAVYAHVNARFTMTRPVL